ncbi:MAG: tetratricopeptide repeat protein [Pirellulaceae bacterium]
MTSNSAVRACATISATYVTLLWIALGSNVHGADFDEAKNAFYSGEYAKCAEITQEQVDKGIWNDFWARQLIQCHLTTGKYEAAVEVFESVAEKFGKRSIPLRLLAAEAYRLTGKAEVGQRLRDEIPELVSNAPWRYSDRANLLAVGRYFLSEGEDARYILESCYDQILKSDSEFAEAHIAIAELALDKSDYQEAVKSLEISLRSLPNDPYISYLLAKAWAPSDGDKATAYLKAALDLNPKHTMSLLLNAEEMIDGERYSEAKEVLAAVLEINSTLPEAWALKAAIAHLEGKYAKEGEFRTQALSTWNTNPKVDFKIGQVLSKHYRFQESIKYQQRSLQLDPSFRPAKFQLAQDLLRNGQDAQGWELVNEVATSDKYNVVAYNLRTLNERLATFTTLETDDFIVRMDAEEAEIYGARVLELLTEAKQTLCEKYAVELSQPTTVEIFPQQSDFAIRTFGLPGGAGFLGVCFGPLVTANSPASQGESPSNWESVLWHEFCHVVTLQKTNNRMPRWLSEGISVAEELERDGSWGQRMDPQYKSMLMGEDFTPLSELSSAFLRPKSPLHLQFAYFESCLAVQYLIETHSLPSLLKVLDDLGMGMAMNDAIELRIGDLATIDEDFRAFATKRADDFFPETSFSSEGIPKNASPEQLDEWAKEHPRNYVAQIALARALIQGKKLQAATPVVRRLLELYPEDVTPGGSLELAATLAKSNEDSEQERQYLRQITQYSADNLLALQRLIELDREEEKWEMLAEDAKRYLAVQPLVPLPHEALVEASTQLDRPRNMLNSLTALLKMDPLDPAGVRFQLARALFETGDTTEARIQCLYALEFAPRYRDAQKLLVEIHRIRTDVEETDTEENIPQPESQAPQPSASSNEAEPTSKLSQPKSSSSEDTFRT